MVEDCPLERNQNNAVIRKGKKGFTITNHTTALLHLINFKSIKAWSFLLMFFFPLKQMAYHLSNNNLHNFSLLMDYSKSM